MGKLTTSITPLLLGAAIGAASMALVQFAAEPGNRDECIIDNLANAHSDRAAGFVAQVCARLHPQPTQSSEAPENTSNPFFEIDPPAENRFEKYIQPE